MPEKVRIIIMLRLSFIPREITRRANVHYNGSSTMVTNIFTGVRQDDDCIRTESLLHHRGTSLLPSLWDLLFLRSSDVGAPRKRDSQESPLFLGRCLKPYIYHHLVEQSFEKDTLEVTSPCEPKALRINHHHS